MQHRKATRSFGPLALGLAIAAAILLTAPAPIALLLALVALPVEAFLISLAVHELTRPSLATQTAA